MLSRSAWSLRVVPSGQATRFGGLESVAEESMTGPWRLTTRVLATAIASFATVLPATAQQAQVDDEILVIGITPLGTGIEASKVPTNVQTATGEEIAEQHLLDLTAYMNANFAGVFVNEGTTNPLQPDVQFRGYSASPLLGLPQGLAVYQDGVRLNEPFGDTVNWALMPQTAVDSMQLIPGAFPVFGLNSLGGAISIRTKDGFSHQGTSAELTGGSWNRIIADVESGNTFGADGAFSYYVNGYYFEEDGWRDFSPSRAARFFTNIGWQGDASKVTVDFTYADTDLIGNGAIPFQLAAVDRNAIFTRPDQTENELFTVNFRGEHGNGPLKLSWNAYYRSSDIASFNGDDSDFGECMAPENEGFICEGDDDDDDDDEEEGEEEEEEEEEELVLDPDGNPIPATEDTLGATVNRTNTQQDTLGGNIQLSWNTDGGFGSNQLIVGANFVTSDIRFDASTELGRLDETRLAIPSGFLVEESFTALETSADSYSAFFINTFSPNDVVSLQVSGQFNSTDIVLRDQLGTALNGDHSFQRFNPAAGVTIQVSDGLQLYGGYFESNRAPTPVELTCADPDDPCRLPNAFLADPPLDDVVANTFEAGLRGTSEWLDWSFGFFRTRNRNDIIFISAGPFTNSGFFDNVGDTTRDGVEMMLNGRITDRGTWFANYTYLNASFDDNFSVSSPNNPLADDGQIEVQKGDRLPGVPEHLAKAGFSFDITPRFNIGGTVNHSSERFLRGDEGNLLPPLEGFTVVNLRGEYRLNDIARFFLTVNNVFDEQYATLGLLGEGDEVLGDDFDDPRFLSPGPPRAAWVGVRVGLR
jgi:iron complex outermembrane receptor protein